jgi:hypothetical protein
MSTPNEFPTQEILKKIDCQGRENLFGKTELTMREVLKMIFTMDMVFSPIQKKLQKTSMKVILRLA